jgi:hypothetical protein
MRSFIFSESGEDFARFFVAGVLLIIVGVAGAWQ